jgi:hypothetical protein
VCEETYALKMQCLILEHDWNPSTAFPPTAPECSEGGPSRVKFVGAAFLRHGS